MARAITNLSKSRSTTQLAADFMNAQHYDPSFTIKQIRKIYSMFQSLSEILWKGPKKANIGYKDAKLEAQLRRIGNKPDYGLD